MISRGLALVSACALLISGAHPQSASDNSSPPQHNSSAQEHEDRSFYLGTPVAHPEDLSGLWEAPDGHGGAIGIHLVLDTTIPVEATTLAGARQSWLGLTLGLYHRSGAEFQLGDENRFSDSLRGGSVRYENDRLILHARGYDLDLHRIDGDKWSGRFHREDIDSGGDTRPPYDATHIEGHMVPRNLEEYERFPNHLPPHSRSVPRCLSRVVRCPFHKRLRELIRHSCQSPLTPGNTTAIS